jgi:uncharacterized SAM-binding protein YcdF (DUF218 family)
MLDWLIRNAVASALMPPGCLLLLAAGGLLVLHRRPWLGRALLGLAIILLYAFSTRFVADHLLHALETPWSNPLAGGPGQAIVVLGAGRYFNAPEYEGDTVREQSLVRLRYAARLHRATGKPVLVAGGSPEGAPHTEAAHMATTLNHDFGVPVQWVEDKSSTTLENARFTRKLLGGTEIKTVYLVTHAWHMPRAVEAFESSGFTVIPAPTGYATRFKLTVLDFVPDARALADSSMWVHEVVGIGWYRIQWMAGRKP